MTILKSFKFTKERLFLCSVDKGNKAVILEKKRSYDRTNQFIADGSDKSFSKNGKRVNNTLKTCSNFFTPGLKRKLHVLINPVVFTLLFPENL